MVVDTSVWIECLKGNAPYFLRFSTLIKERLVIGLECIFGELLQGTRNARERSLILDYWNHLPKIDEKRIWIDAGKFSAENKLCAKGVGLIDAVIILGARRACAKIWTQDKKLLAVLEKDETFNHT